MIEFLAKFLARHSMSITVFLILLPVLLQFKPIIYSSVIRIYDEIPSYNRAYDLIISMRNPLSEKKITQREKFVNDIMSSAKKQELPPQIARNLETTILELLRIEIKENDFFIKQKVNEALKGIKALYFT